MKKKEKTHRRRQQHGDDQREREVGKLEEGKGGKMVMEGDLTWGGVHTIQYTGGIYVILLTRVTQNNSINKK